MIQDAIDAMRNRMREVIQESKEEDDKMNQKRIIIIEDCSDCPHFFLSYEEDEDDCHCKKLLLNGNQKNLFKVCPLPIFKFDENVSQD